MTSQSVREAVEEFDRWFKRREESERKAQTLAKIASDFRAKKIDYAEAQRRKRATEGTPTVYDGEQLFKAAKTLLSAYERQSALLDEAEAAMQPITAYTAMTIDDEDGDGWIAERIVGGIRYAITFKALRTLRAVRSKIKKERER